MLRSAMIAAVLAGTALLGSGCAPAPHAYVAHPLIGEFRIAVLPLANYSGSPEAAERVGPMVAVALARRKHIEVVDMGMVEDALAQNPWIMTDRVPPDLVDAIGAQLRADALLIGSVLAYGFRSAGGEQVPQVSLSLRLVETPGGRVLWSAVHSRDGRDQETIFGFGNVPHLEKLAEDTVAEIVGSFPKYKRPSQPSKEKLAEGGNQR